MSAMLWSKLRWGRLTRPASSSGEVVQNACLAESRYFLRHFLCLFFAIILGTRPPDADSVERQSKKQVSRAVRLQYPLHKCNESRIVILV